MLNGTNYKDWKLALDLYMITHDNMDMCLHHPVPYALNDLSTAEDRKYHADWYRSNQRAKILIRSSMSSIVRGSIEEPVFARDFLDNIEAKYKESNKAEAARLNKEYNELKYNGNGSIRNHIMKLIELNSRLRELEQGVKNEQLVHHALDSLPPSFSVLRTSYNAQKENWSLDDLISICVDEESRMRKEKQPATTVNLVQKHKWKKNKLKVNKTIAKPSSSTAGAKANKPFKFKCYFCKKVGHMKKDCSGFKAWLEKKGKINSLNLLETFSLEVNFVNIEPHTYWLDSGSPLHITNSLQGFIRKRKPRNDEVNVCVGNGMPVAVKAVGSLKLDLGFGNFLILDNVFYVPSIKRNLLSVSLLAKLGCCFLIDSSGIKIFKDSSCFLIKNCSTFGSGVIENGYLKLNCSLPQQDCMLVENRKNTLSNNTIGVKRTLHNEKSAYLWHRRLGHISRERLQILVKNKTLPELDFSDLEDCIECFKGKMTNIRRKNASRSNKLLELIHTDICGPFRHRTICGNVYFITFIDDFSRYCYVYLLSEKSQSLEAFKIFRTEVEHQLELKIKTVRSDRGGEFYGRYTEQGQQKGPFALYLQENGIKAQYTTPYNPQQNGVAERKNRTLLNMVRSMMCTSGLPRMLWGEALRTANYLCNRTPSKSVSKTPYELWTGKQPSLHHCHVWGCNAEARIYNPKINKLDSKSVSCHFIGYCEKSKGYKLYSADHSPRIFETHQVKFLGESVCNTNFEDLTSDFEEIVDDDDSEAVPDLQNKNKNPVQNQVQPSQAPNIVNVDLEPQNHNHENHIP